MTQEEKAKAYDEALKYAMIYYKEGNEDMKMMMKTCFPALVEESEDERIRKALISFLKSPFVNESITDEKVTPWIAWLEKQGNSSEQIHYWTEEEIEPIISDYLRGAEHYGGMIARLRCLKPKSLEKQGEQKPILDFKAKDWYASKVDGKIHNIYNSVDRIEPKFKVGDIIINIHYKWDGKHRIREITDGKYIFDGGSYIKIKEQDSWELANKVEPKFKVYVLVI